MGLAWMQTAKDSLPAFQKISTKDPLFAYLGPVVQNLTMSLVNLLLKLWSLNMAYTLIFFSEKKCE